MFILHGVANIFLFILVYSFFRNRWMDVIGDDTHEVKKSSREKDGCLAVCPCPVGRPVIVFVSRVKEG